MLRRKKRLSTICILSFFLLSILFPCFLESKGELSSSKVPIQTIQTISQNLTVHDPINITRDSEFSEVAVNGSGTSNDPYILANWNITGSSTNGIYINGTTKYFRIENCVISSSNNYGIYVTNIAPGTATIVNNICNNNVGAGISLYYSNFSLLANNTCNSNYALYSPTGNGIHISHSSSLILVNNTCKYNTGSGLSLWFSNSSTIVANICADNGYRGLTFWYSHSSTIVSNICDYNAGDGLSLWHHNSSTVSNNTCKYNREAGLSLWHSVSSAVVNNSCNNNDGDGIHVYGGNTLILKNNTCNYNIANGFRLRQIYYSSITNSTCESNNDGASLEDSEFNSITNNIFLDNLNYGLKLSIWAAVASSNNEIHHNSFINNGNKESQASDNGTNNKWYDQTVKEGNIWSDFSGTGCYVIAGRAGAKDLYPSNLTGTYAVNITCSSSSSFTSAFTYFIIFLAIGLIVFIRRYNKSV